MLKLLTAVFAFIAIYLIAYYGNAETYEITYQGRTEIYTSGDAPQIIIHNNLEHTITDNQDVLVGKLKPFSDTMKVGHKYIVQLAGWDNFILGPKNIISVE